MYYVLMKASQWENVMQSKENQLFLFVKKIDTFDQCCLQKVQTIGSCETMAVWFSVEKINIGGFQFVHNVQRISVRNRIIQNSVKNFHGTFDAYFLAEINFKFKATFLESLSHRQIFMSVPVQILKLI